MKYYTLSLIWVLFLSMEMMSCSENNETDISGKGIVSKTSLTEQEKTSTNKNPSNPAKIIKPRPASDMIATNSKLEGGWISDKDDMFQIQFKGSEYAEYNNGKLIRKGSYQLTDCKNASCADCKPMPTCLILQINGKKICYSIVIADGVDLRMSAAGAETQEFHRN